jgi:hypothetical protein
MSAACVSGVCAVEESEVAEDLEETEGSPSHISAAMLTIHNSWISMHGSYTLPPKARQWNPRYIISLPLYSLGRFNSSMTIK